MYSYKKFIFSSILIFFLIQPAYPETKLVSKSELTPTKEHIVSTRIITQLLENYHYKPAKLTDEFSLLVFNKYINALDPMKIYFTKADIEQFKHHSTKIDDYLKTASIEPLLKFLKNLGQG